MHKEFESAAAATHCGETGAIANPAVASFDRPCSAGRIPHRRMLSRAMGAAACAVAVLLAACGGGGGSGGEESAATHAPEAHALNAGQAKESATLATVSPMSPSDPRWATTSQCNDSDFIAITGNVPANAALLSRHVACALLVSDPQPITVWLMRNADDTGWEFYKRTAGREPSSFVAGYVTLSTKWQIYGEPKDLNKQHALQSSIKTWTREPSFPLPTATLTGEFEPQVECSPSSVGAGITALPCSFTRPSAIALSLASGSSGSTVGVNILFDWTKDSSSSSPDMASFTTALKTFVYKVRESDLPAGQDKLTVNAAGSSGASFEPEIRCDKGLTTNAGKGCVMPAAAAVLVMNSAATDPASEAAIHVRDAQQAAQPGMTDRAPGVYLPLAGTRAVADVRFETPYFPLQYTKDAATSDANRKASCQLASSLFMTRPYSGSTSCPARGTTGCQCDEYPFATTTNGSSSNPGTTSVRGILTAHNRAGGTQWQQFLQAQRVLPAEVTTDPAWVYVK